MKINAKLHKANRMPKNPTLDQRIEWHIEHAKDCACWPIPPKLQAEIDKRKMSDKNRNVTPLYDSVL